jgi:hypothetical protein
LESNRWIEVRVECAAGDVLEGRACWPSAHRQERQTEVTVENTQKSNKIIDLQPFAG